MIGSAIGLGMQAAGAIFGGVQASKAMNKVKENLEGRKADNRNWFDRRYNEDATQRADAQRILAKTEESIRNRNRQAAAMQAVSGGSEEAAMAAKAANNDAVAEAMSQIAVHGAARKDDIESTYRLQESRLDDSLNQMEVDKANAITKAAQGVADVGSQFAKSFG